MEAKYKKLRGEGETYRVWDGPVRLLHWLNAIAVGVLIYTGFAISGMVSRATGDEPAFGFSMANVRNIHYVAAMAFTCAGLVRLYWFAAGHNYRQWFRYNLWEGSFWREVGWKLKEYVTLRYLNHEAHTLGHNALASLAYFLVFIAGAVLVVTGFAMRGMIDPGGWSAMLFGWVIPLFGSEANVRAIHRLSMWFMIAFIIHHVAIVVYLDILGERGLVSSMIIGLKIRPAGWKPTEKPWLETR